jgi:ribosomal protein S18 acetylase RimI-like enzyme
VTDAEVLTLADLNLAEATREMARWQRDYRIEERDDLLFVADADPFPVGHGNCVMALGPRAPESPEQVVAQADQFFGRLGRGYTTWIRDHLDAPLEAHLQKAGLSSISNTPGMVLDAPTPDRPLDAGLRVSQVEDAGTMSTLAAVEAAGYATIGMPANITERIFANPERLLNPHSIVVLGYLEERPVSAAIAILSNGIAGLYWVVTLPEARGRGLGEACTRLAGNRAFELGARCVVLQASEQGEPIYRRMGYREITRYRWYAKGP